MIKLIDLMKSMKNVSFFMSKHWNAATFTFSRVSSFSAFFVFSASPICSSAIPDPLFNFFRQLLKIQKSTNRITS